MRQDVKNIIAGVRFRVYQCYGSERLLIGILSTERKALDYVLGLAKAAEQEIYFEICMVNRSGKEQKVLSGTAYTYNQPF